MPDTAPPRKTITADSFMWLSVASVLALSVVELGATRMWRWPWWLLYEFGALSALAGSACWLMQRRLNSKTSTLVAMGWLVLSLSAWRSPYPGTAFSSTIWYAAAWGWGHWLYQWINDDIKGQTRRSWLRNGIGLLFVFLSLQSLLWWLLQNVLPSYFASAGNVSQWGTEAASFDLTKLRNSFPFGHANYTAGMAVIIIPWLTGLAWTNRGKHRVFWITGTFAALAMLASSGSRGGLLGLSGAVICGVITVWPKITQPRLRKWIIVGLILTCTIPLGNNRLRQSVFHLSDPEQLPSLSDIGRSAMIEAGYLMGSERPLTGWGAGTTPTVYPKFRYKLGEALENSYQLHSQPVTFWAEGGAITLALCMIVLLFPLLIGWRRGAKDPLQLFALCSLCGYSVMLLTDSQLDIPFFVWMLASLVACAWPVSIKSSVVQKRGFLALGALVLLMFFAVPFLWREARLRQDLHVAMTQLDRGEFRKCRATLVETANRNPKVEALANAITWLDLQVLAQISQDSSSRALLGRQIRHWLNQSIEANADQNYPYFNLGWLLSSTEPEHALIHFQSAAHYSPARKGLYLGVYEAQKTSGASDAQLDQSLARECLLNPGFTVSPIWANAEFQPRWPFVKRLVQNQLLTIASDETRPAWVRREAKYYDLWLDWWDGATNLPALCAVSNNPERKRFFTELTLTRCPPAITDAQTPVWMLLLEAGKKPESEQTRLIGAAVARKWPRKTPLDRDELIASMRQAIADGWPAKPRPTSPLSIATHNQLTGQPLLDRLTDLPPLVDYSENLEDPRLLFLSFTLPRSGWCLPYFPQD